MFLAATKRRTKLPQIHLKINYILKDPDEIFVDEVKLTPTNPKTGEELPDIPQVRGITASQIISSIFANGFFPQEKENVLHFTPTSRIKDVFVEFPAVSIISDPASVNAVKNNKIHVVQ
jgi:hypothetical protein